MKRKEFLILVGVSLFIIVMIAALHDEMQTRLKEQTKRLTRIEEVLKLAGGRQ